MFCRESTVLSINDDREVHEKINSNSEVENKITRRIITNTGLYTSKNVNTQILTLN